MANQEQLDRLLKQGVQAWNEWRAVNWGIGIVLSDADLSHAVLRDARLNGADLSSTILNGANLSDARLNGADLGSANLSDALQLHFKADQ